MNRIRQCLNARAKEKKMLFEEITGVREKHSASSSQIVQMLIFKYVFLPFYVNQTFKLSADMMKRYCTCIVYRKFNEQNLH